MSNHAADPDRDPDGQIYVADAKPGSAEKALTPLDMPAGRGRPEWSPDGKWIAFLKGEEKKCGAYGMEHLALVAADGSAQPTLVKAAADLDRGVTRPISAPMAAPSTFIVTDDRSVYPARIPSAAEPRRS